MNQINQKKLLLPVLTLVLISLTWSTNKPVSSPKKKMKMVMDKIQREKDYEFWGQQEEQLKGINMQRKSLEQRLDMIFGRNPGVAQFFSMYKQSIDKEINFNKKLASLTWKIMPSIESKVKLGEASREDLILLAKMHGYLDQRNEKIAAYAKAHAISELNRSEEEDRARTLKAMNKALESIESWSRLVKMPGLTKDQRNTYKLEMASANFYIHRFEKSLEILNEMQKDSQWKSKTQQLYTTVSETKKNWAQELEYQKSDNDLPRVEIITGRGRIVVELFEDDAPNGVANFINLVEKKYYDGQKFHRVIPNFMAQGGDVNSKNDNPNDDGQGGPGYTIKTDLNKRKHFRGSLSYANAGIDTDGSQFFLCVVPTTWLDGRHAVFGRIIEGQLVADSLVKDDELRSMKILNKRKNSKYEVKKNN